MSLIARTFECPKCLHRWEVIEPRDSAPPKFCVECGARFAKTLLAVPGTHSIGGSRVVKAVDDTYQRLERAGEARMRLAERDGVPASQARQLKITNLKDNVRDGEVGAVRPTVNNPTTQFMAEAAKRGLNYGFGGGMGLAPPPGAPAARVAPMMQMPDGQYTGPGHIGLRAAQLDHKSNLRAVVESGKR